MTVRGAAELSIHIHLHGYSTLAALFLEYLRMTIIAFIKLFVAVVRVYYRPHTCLMHAVCFGVKLQFADLGKTCRRDGQEQS